MKRTVVRVTIAAACAIWSGVSFAADDSAKPVTLAGLGRGFFVDKTNGDTWDGAWLANDKVYLQHDDGFGWDGKGGYRGINELLGTPEAPSSLSGVNVPSKCLAQTYSTGIYEVDGILYHSKCYSTQGTGKWDFRNVFILKSADGGQNWINHLGQTNAMPRDNLNECMFPAKGWGHVNFVKYGRGGAAPDIDNARTYVYFCSPVWWPAQPFAGFRLARMKRTDLPTLDRSKIQFYKGGDGMLDAGWTNDIAMATYICTLESSPTAMVYNEPLGRYIMTSWSGAAHPCLLVMQAPHPWGPWELLLEQNREDRDTKASKPGDWSWIYLMPKFTSTDGKKMWMTAQGKCYGLNFMPLYLTTHPVQKYEAEETLLEGTKTSGEKEGFSGKGYVTGFDAGDQCLFRASVKNTGAYILNVRYNAPSSQRMDILVNGAPLGKTTLGKSGKVDTAWADMSFCAWLTGGENTIALRCAAAGEAADLNLDRLSLAFYSDVPGSLPDCGPAATKPK